MQSRGSGERVGNPKPGNPAGWPTPGPDDRFSLAQAARVAGVDRSYLYRIAVDTPPAVSTRPDGRPVQYLLGVKDGTGPWRIEPSELARFMGARRPPNAVPAYDLAVRAPKSVSILHALGHLLDRPALVERGLAPGTSIPAEVLAAHQVAVGDTIGFLERHAAFVRGPGGRVPATGLSVAVFDHRSSREGDPLLHSHLVIANVARGVDGRWAALDSTALYAWARTAGHVYQARLRCELGRRLGVVFDQPHNGLADIEGMPRPAIDLFSERRRQILRRLARLGLSGARAAQVATLDTRAAKSVERERTPDEQARRAARVGFGAKEVASLVGHGCRPRPPGKVAGVADHMTSPDGLCERSSTVDLRDAICGFATGLPEGATAPELERWSACLLADPARFLPVLGAKPTSTGVVHRADGTAVPAGGPLATFTTPELLGHEATLVALFETGRAPAAPRAIATPNALDTAIASRPTLRAEQETMVRAITTSGRGVEVVVGGPGTGKTFALGAAAQAWKASGLRVVGASLQGGAAEILATEAGLPSQYTLTSLLGTCHREGAGFLARTVVIVDEASMADTRQLALVTRYAAAAGAKLVLVGDPDQIPEVEAGGAFAHLVSRCGADLVALRENHRQVDPRDRHRLTLVRDAKAADAIASAQAAGRWHSAATADEVRELLLRDWHTAPGVAGFDKFLVATTVSEVEGLNVAARAIYAAEDRLGAEPLVIELNAPDRAVDQRELRTGDRVRATRNQWDKAVFTGRVGTVVALDPGDFTVTVELDPMRDGTGAWRPRQVVTFDTTFLHERQVTGWWGGNDIQAPGLTHAYASTANGVEGRTGARSYVLLCEAGLYRQAAYVALSRARLETHLYGMTVPDPDELAAHDRQAPDPDPADTAGIARAMASDGSQTMASVIDPLAADAGSLLSQPRSWLLAERKHMADTQGAPPRLPEALRQVRTTLANAYGLPLADLECHQLSNAMTSALQIPGATPQRLGQLMLGRHKPGCRELASARDPIAVLVWAAGDHAVTELAAEAAGQRSTPSPATVLNEQRLRLLDTALARQHDHRLALAEHDQIGPCRRLLGPPPGHPGGLTPWRRAAAAILHYRDSAGRADHSVGAGDPWIAALGPRPIDADLAAHYDQTRQVIGEARAAAVLAELPAYTPQLRQRPDATVAALAQRSLAELSALREAALPVLEPDQTLNKTSAVVDISEPRTIDQAIAVRIARLGSWAVNGRPAWVRRDVEQRVDDPLGPIDTRPLADYYKAVAVYLDRSGRPLDEPDIDTAIGPRPPEREQAAEWSQVRTQTPAPAINPPSAVVEL
jgi:conjugative relaxase-like TrwC/TraI family protein